MFKDDDLTDISVGDIKAEVRTLCKEFKKREILDFLDAFDVYYSNGINRIEIIGIGEILEFRSYYVETGPKLELIFKEKNNLDDNKNYYQYMVENNLFL